VILPQSKKEKLVLLPLNEIQRQLLSAFEIKA
jgi:hypothetical protein